MDRRSFLRMVGLAPVAGVAIVLPDVSASAVHEPEVRLFKDVYPTGMPEYRFVLTPDQARSIVATNVRNGIPDFL